MWLGVLGVRLVDGSHLTYVQIHNSKVLGYGFGTPICISVLPTGLQNRGYHAHRERRLANRYMAKLIVIQTKEFIARG
jgi:hypothetical protein